MEASQKQLPSANQYEEGYSNELKRKYLSGDLLKNFPVVLHDLDILIEGIPDNIGKPKMKLF